MRFDLVLSLEYKLIEYFVWFAKRKKTIYLLTSRSFNKRKIERQHAFKEVEYLRII